MQVKPYYVSLSKKPCLYGGAFLYYVIILCIKLLEDSMMRKTIKITADDVRGSDDGINSRPYDKGETYTVGEKLANVLIEGNLAEEVKEAAKKTEKAPENKAVEAAPENKAQKKTTKKKK